MNDLVSAYSNGGGRIGAATGAETIPDKAWSAEDQAKWETRKKVQETTNRAHNSLTRVVQVIDSAQRGQTEDGLFKSDLDNAIRHSMQVTKQLRAIKASLYATEKPTVPGPSTPTQQTII